MAGRQQAAALRVAVELGTAQTQSRRIARHVGMLDHGGVQLGKERGALALQEAVIVQVQRDVLVRKGVVSESTQRVAQATAGKRATTGGCQPLATLLRCAV